MTITYLNSLFNRKLSPPLEVFTFEVDGRFYANNARYKIHEFAATPEEAMDKFIHEITYMYNTFMDLDNMLEV